MAGTWKKLKKPPGFQASTMLLLTDGSVMCQQSGGLSWSRLVTDQTGDYVNGTWTAIAPMINTRLYYASAVLGDGRVIVGGGEYSNAGTVDGTSIQNETNRCEMYDPLTNTWTAVTPPAGWTNMGDAPCSLLPDGRLLVGYYDGIKTAIYDPVANHWTVGPNKGASGSEETWTLLGDQTVLTVQCSNRPNAEKYVVGANQWVSAGTLPVDLVEAASLEIGPACLLPDGRAFCIGATGHNALYTPPANASLPGSWMAAPDTPKVNGQTIGAKDAPACLLPNGKVLFVGGPVDGKSDSYLTPTYFFEFDGTIITRVPDPPNSTQAPYMGRMLLVPTGQVLFAAETNDVYCYTPDGNPRDAWRPTITATPSSIQSGLSYTLQGAQINGLSQAVSYGDDSAAATNYPIVRIRHIASGHIFYCRTFDHSTMAVATGSSLQTTNFYVPLDVPAGQGELTIIANGIPSQPIAITCLGVKIPRSPGFETWQWLFGSLADGPLWVWDRHGPIPVDPWGPELKKRASAARKQMLAGMRTLQKLGEQVVKKRDKAATKVPPAVDLEAVKGKAQGATQLVSRKKPVKGPTKRKA